MLFHLAEPAALIGMLLAFLIGIYARDTAQVVTARLVRDPRPMADGRLVAAPKERISPFSAVAFLITGSGWAEPIRMNDVWRKRRFHIALAILAGPLAYLLLAFLSLVALTAVSEQFYVHDGDRVVEIWDIGFGGEVLAFMAITFASLFVVSLIPVPPTDGGRVLFLLAPQTHGWRNANMKLSENNWGIGILLLLLLLPVLLSGFPSVVGQLAPPLLRGLGGLIGLSTG